MSSSVIYPATNIISIGFIVSARAILHKVSQLGVCRSPFSILQISLSLTPQAVPNFF